MMRANVRIQFSYRALQCYIAMPNPCRCTIVLAPNPLGWYYANPDWIYNCACDTMQANRPLRTESIRERKYNVRFQSSFCLRGLVLCKNQSSIAAYSSYFSKNSGSTALKLCLPSLLRKTKPSRSVSPSTL